MASENAKAVAQEVKETILSGKQVNLTKIQLNHGYSYKSAATMVAKRTKTYKEEMASFTELLESEISKIQLEMASRDISKERYGELAKVLDTLYKNKQLATGGDTARERILVLPPEVTEKYGIKITSGSETDSK